MGDSQRLPAHQALPSCLAVVTSCIRGDAPAAVASKVSDQVGGSGVLHFSGDWCASTWRAPSSPHLACGLNGSFFLHTCEPLPAVQAGRLLAGVRWLKACGTLH